MTRTTVLHQSNLLVKVITGTYPTDSAYLTVTAPAVSGYRFLYFTSPGTVGWSCPLYFEHPDQQTSNLFTGDGTKHANADRYNAIAVYQTI